MSGSSKFFFPSLWMTHALDRLRRVRAGHTDNGQGLPVVPGGRDGMGPAPIIVKQAAAGRSEGIRFAGRNAGMAAFIRRDLSSSEDDIFAQ